MKSVTTEKFRLLFASAPSERQVRIKDAYRLWKENPGHPSLTPAQLKAMVPMRALRGRPKSEDRKLLVSVRYSPEVVAYFKSTGDGWQSRMDGVLRQYVVRHSGRA